MSTVKTPASEKKATKKKTPSAAKKKLALEVIARLKKEYPETHCTLAYDKAWQLLVSVRLAAQCTDKRVDMVTPLLYEKFPTAAALAEAPVDEIEEIVRPCGLGPSKARDISKCMKMLQEEYGGKVPDTMEELLKLPGVGRKSANLVLGDVFGKPAIVTDTHCIRLANPVCVARRPECGRCCLQDICRHAQEEAKAAGKAQTKTTAKAGEKS